MEGIGEGRPIVFKNSHTKIRKRRFKVAKKKVKQEETKKFSNDLNEKLADVLELADKVGAEQSFYYKTTLARYQTQLNIISEVQKKAKQVGWTKDLINDYNKTCTSANNTVATLMKIITTLAENGLVNSDSEDSLFV